FDVTQAPLMRCIVACDTAYGRYLLLWLVHHLTSDHTTLEIMIQEAQSYLAASGRTASGRTASGRTASGRTASGRTASGRTASGRLGEANRLPEPLPFRNFVAQARMGSERADHEAFFREMLGNVEEPTAPFGMVNVRGDGSNIEQARVELEPELVLRLREGARALGVSAASLCHVAWARVLAELSGREDVVFGTVLLGRMGGGEGVAHVLGLFINTLPIRIRLGKQGVEQSVRQTHVLLGEMMRHEHASLALAQKCSRGGAQVPLFSALLNYRHSRQPAEPSPEAALAWGGIEMLDSAERTNYPLTVSVDDLGEGFWLTVQAVKPIEPVRIGDYMRTALKQL